MVLCVCGEEELGGGLIGIGEWGRRMPVVV